MNALIVGMGKLGGFIAYKLLKSPNITKIYINSKNSEKLDGIHVDLEQAFPNKTILKLNDFSELDETIDYAFFCFSTLQWKKTIGVNDRLIEAKSNLKILNSIKIAPIIKYIFILSNPVDLLTRFTQELFPDSEVYGIGIGLDCVRVGQQFSKIFKKVYKPIPCIGEHGAGLVPLLSQTSKKNISYKDYKLLLEKTFVDTQKIIQNYAIPHFGPWIEIEKIISAITNRKPAIFYLSKYLSTEYLNVQNVAIGVPMHFEKDSFSIQKIKINKIEQKLFEKTAEQLKIRYYNFI